MRIFVAVRHSVDPRFYYGGLWSGNFHPALQQLGHEIVRSRTDLLPASRFMHVGSGFTSAELERRARITHKILDEVRAAHRERPVELFLSYFYNAHFDPAGFDELRRLGIPSVNFYCNSIYQFELVSAIAAKADFAWHAERDARAAYISVGANPVWVQMAADPRVYRPIPETTRTVAACFVGQRYADRDRWMASLIRAGISLSIYGPGWSPQSGAGVATADLTQTTGNLGRHQHRPGSAASYASAAARTIRRYGLTNGIARVARQVTYKRKTAALSPLFASHAHGPVPFERIAEVFAAHEVCLNFSNVWADGSPGSKLIPHVRLRDFEAPMCRTCYLTGESDEIREFYEVGHEIETYSSTEELIDKARFYLNNASAAEKLREAGYRRALADHTWLRRFEELFRKMGLAPSRRSNTQAVATSE